MTADGHRPAARVGSVARAAPIGLEHVLAAGVGRAVNDRAPQVRAADVLDRHEEDRMTAVDEQTATTTDEPSPVKPAERVLRWDPEAPTYGHLATDEHPGSTRQPRFTRFVDLSDPLVQWLLAAVETTSTTDDHGIQWSEFRRPLDDPNDLAA